MATKKQGELKGIEKRTIKEVEDAAFEYKEIRDERMALTEKETEAQATLLITMKKHKLKSYRLTDGEDTFDVTVEPSEEVARVRKVKDKPERPAKEESAANGKAEKALPEHVES